MTLAELQFDYEALQEMVRVLREEMDVLDLKMTAMEQDNQWRTHFQPGCGEITCKKSATGPRCTNKGATS